MKMTFDMPTNVVGLRRKRTALAVYLALTTAIQPAAATSQQQVQPQQTGFDANGVLKLAGTTFDFRCNYRATICPTLRVAGVDLQFTGPLTITTVTQAGRAHSRPVDPRTVHGNGFLTNRALEFPRTVLERQHATGSVDIAFQHALSSSIDILTATVGSQIHEPVRALGFSHVHVLSDLRILAGATFFLGLQEYACVIRLMPTGTLDTSYYRTGFHCLNRSKGSWFEEWHVASTGAVIVSNRFGTQYGIDSLTYLINHDGVKRQLSTGACPEDSEALRFFETKSGHRYVYWSDFTWHNVTKLCAGWSRYDADWNIDRTFGVSGTNMTLDEYVTPDFGSDTALYAARTLTEATSNPLGHDSRFITLSRYFSDGVTLDPAFGVAGSITRIVTSTVTAPLGTNTYTISVVSGIAVAADGAVYMVGWYREVVDDLAYYLIIRSPGIPRTPKITWLPLAPKRP